MSDIQKLRGSTWWRGFWEQALTGGEMMVNVRLFDVVLHEMIAELEAREVAALRETEDLEAENPGELQRELDNTMENNERYLRSCETAETEDLELGAMLGKE